MKNYKQILTEASLGRFYQQLVGDENNESKAIAILTASRAANSSAVNNARNADLRRVLRQFIAPTLKTEHKVGFYKVVGTYAETQDDGTSKRVKEDSTVVVIPPIPTLVERFKHICMVLGAKFEQDSIFFAEKGQAKLIYTRDITDENGAVVQKKGSVTPLGAFHPQALGLAFTKIKGKSFAFDWIQEAADLGYVYTEDPELAKREEINVWDWYRGVENQPVTVYITPCRPECSYEENHLKAEAFLKDLKDAQYGSLIDGLGQFSFDKIGYIQHPVNGSELYKELHVDTFVICGMKEHENYIRSMVNYLAKKHHCRFAMFHFKDEENFYVWNFEDNSSPYEAALNGKAGTVASFPYESYPPEHILLNGFAPYSEDNHFEIEDSSVMTNPKDYNDSIRLNSIYNKIVQSSPEFHGFAH